MADSKKSLAGGLAIAAVKRKINNALSKAEKARGKNKTYYKEMAKIHQDELKEIRKKYPNAGIKQGPKQTVYQKNPKLGVLMNRRAKNFVRGDITKKMNMGGVMKARGGTFKGVY